jgi:hypothetical protein
LERTPAADGLREVLADGEHVPPGAVFPDDDPELVADTESTRGTHSSIGRVVSTPGSDGVERG